MRIRYLPIDDDVKQKFIGYFNEGLMPCEAMLANENLLLVQGHSVEALASGASNPSVSTVYYLHRKWRTQTFGSISKPPLEMLKDKVSLYSERGTFSVC